MDKPTILLITLNVLLIFLVLLTKSKKSINKLFLVLTSILITLSLVEIGYRVFFEQETYYAGDFNKRFYEHDSTLGYRMERTGKFDAIKINSNGDTLFHTSYTIIADTAGNHPSLPRRMGYHNPRDSNELVFLGCSFTFGEGLSDQQNLPYLIGEQNEWNVVNLGCTGYGIHQVYELYRSKYGRTDNRNRTFIYSFLYDHILRATGLYEWNLGGPYLISRGDSIVNAGPLSTHVRQSSGKFAHYVSLFGSLRFLKKIISHLFEKKRLNSINTTDYENTLNILKHMAKLISHSGGKLIVLDWDTKNWGNDELNNLPNELIERYLDQLNFPNVQVVRISSITSIQDPSNFIPGDGHPSAWMNYKIANHLGKILEATNNN